MQECMHMDFKLTSPTLFIFISFSQSIDDESKPGVRPKTKNAKRNPYFFMRNV